MKNKDLFQKIKVLRNRKGYSQEELSEKTGLSLRTIQRIENGETVARGDSLKRLAAVLEVSPDEFVDLIIQDDKDFLFGLNLSALSLIICPILGILIPLIIWISKKDKIPKLNEMAKELLNFQITWTMIIFVGYILLVSTKILRIFSLNLNGFVLFIVIMYLYNLVFIIANSIKINKGKTVNYYPKICFLKK